MSAAVMLCLQKSAQASLSGHTLLRRKCACGGEVHADGECAECKRRRQLQRAAVNNGPVPSVPHSVHEVLREPGSALDAPVRRFMESRFGFDFSGVRVHASDRAAESARAVDALAYTVGNRVVFGAGQLNTATATGRHLLAHELAHVVQQTSHPSTSAPLHIDSDSGAEFEANRAADAVMRNSSVSALGSYSDGRVARQETGTETMPNVERVFELDPTMFLRPMDTFAAPAKGKCEEFPGGSTECVVDPKTGTPTGKVTSRVDEKNPCTRPCVEKHEAVHVRQLKKLCPELRECYLAADAGKRSPVDCAKMAVFGMAERECEAYKVSLPCVRDRLKSAKACQSDANKEYGGRKLASEQCFHDANCGTGKGAGGSGSRGGTIQRAVARYAAADMAGIGERLVRQPLQRTRLLQRQESDLDRAFKSAAWKRAREFRPRFGEHVPRAPTTQPAPGPRTGRRGTPCLSGPQCQLAIPGSATDFGARVDLAQEERQRQIQTNPAVRAAAGTVRPATELTAFYAREAPGVLAGITAIMVNPAIGESAGAQVGPCRLITPRPADPNAVCIEVPDAFEREATTYNNQPNAAQIGSGDRDAWRIRALEMVTHETAHVRFERGASAGITTRDATSFTELDELFALLSEFPLFFREARREQPTPEKQEERSRGVMRRLINKPGEGIRGILTRLRCLHPCDAVDANVRTVFRAASVGWSREDVRLALSELGDPSNHLGWPIPPPPTVGAPAPPPRPRPGPLYRPRGGFYDALGRTEEDL